MMLGRAPHLAAAKTDGDDAQVVSVGEELWLYLRSGRHVGACNSWQQRTDGGVDYVWMVGGAGERVGERAAGGLAFIAAGCAIS